MITSVENSLILPEEMPDMVLHHEMGSKYALMNGLGGPILSAAMAMMQQGWVQWRSSGCTKGLEVSYVEQVYTQAPRVSTVYMQIDAGGGQR